MPSLKHGAQAALLCALALSTGCLQVPTHARDADAGSDAGETRVDTDPAQVDEDASTAEPDAAEPVEDTPVDETVRVMLGTEGGPIELAGVGAVAVPAAALIESIELSAREVPMQQLPTLLAGTADSALELTPHGRLFDQPITITLQYDPASVTDNLAVMRLDDPLDQDWEKVEGATFENGVASFKSTTFSYYTVVTFPEPTCANLPAATASCGGACTAAQYCASAAVCTAIAQNNLCANTKIYAMRSGETTVDNPSAEEMAAAFASHCGGSVTLTAPDDAAVVQACSTELLVGGGSTVFLAGGPATNLPLRYLDRRISPVFLDTDGSMQQFKTRAGTVLVQFDPSSITPSHDYFMIQLFPDTARGALVVSAFGREGPGTRAAAYYFTSNVVPALRAGNRSWGKYIVVEWTDSGDLIPNAADMFVVRASDPLPPPPPVTPPPPTTETPYQSNATGTLATGQSVNAAAGYKFTPQANGKITALGGYFSATKTVKLFKGSTVLASASVTGTGNSWVYTNITPIALTAGTQYTVAVYLGGSGGAKRTSGPTLPKVFGNVRIDAPTQASTSWLNPNAVPTTNSSPTTTMLGLVDIKFIKD